jgi:hypothetical protein
MMVGGLFYPVDFTFEIVSIWTRILGCKPSRYPSWRCDPCVEFVNFINDVRDYLDTATADANNSNTFALQI